MLQKKLSALARRRVTECMETENSSNKTHSMRLRCCATKVYAHPYVRYIVLLLLMAKKFWAHIQLESLCLEGFAFVKY